MKVNLFKKLDGLKGPPSICNCTGACAAHSSDNALQLHKKMTKQKFGRLLFAFT